MDSVKGRLSWRPFEHVNVLTRLHESGGGVDADEITGGDETMSTAAEIPAPMAVTLSNQSSSAPRTSELAISFEGEVYVFSAATRKGASSVAALGRSADTK